MNWANDAKRMRGLSFGSFHTLNAGARRIGGHFQKFDDWVEANQIACKKDFIKSFACDLTILLFG